MDTRRSLQLQNPPREEPSLDHGTPTIPTPYLLRENVPKRLRGHWHELLRDFLKAASALEATPTTLGEVWDEGPELEGEGTRRNETDLPSELSSQSLRGEASYTQAHIRGPCAMAEAEAGPEDRRGERSVLSMVAKTMQARRPKSCVQRMGGLLRSAHWTCSLFLELCLLNCPLAHTHNKSKWLSLASQRTNPFIRRAEIRCPHAWKSEYVTSHGRPPPAEERFLARGSPGFWSRSCPWWQRLNG